MKSSLTTENLERFARIVVDKWTEVVLRPGELMQGLRDWEAWKEKYLSNVPANACAVEYGELRDLFPEEMIERALVLGRLPD